MKIEELAGWIPIRLYWREGRPWLDWCYLGQERFREPFFEQTIELRLRRPFCLLFRHQTPLEILADAGSRLPFLPPSGFIFHMSRAGSTLISQMLAASTRNIVVSEASAIGTLLSGALANPAVAESERITWLRGLVSALGQKRNPVEEHYVIKFNCLDALQLPLIGRAFPDVPWIFVYRDPVEVLVSHQRERGLQLLPGLPALHLDSSEDSQDSELSLDEACARMLARICQTALENLPTGGGMLVNYRQLPESVAGSILPWFKMLPTPGELEQMEQVSRLSAKEPATVFAADSARKQEEASAELRHLAARWVEPVYQRMELARTARGD